MNTALAAYQAAGNEINNFSDVVDALKDGGYIVANLNPTTDGYYYVWNKETNRMMFVDDKLKVTYPDELAEDTPDENWYFAVSTVEKKTALLSNSALTGKTVNVAYAPEEYPTLLADINALGTDGGEVIIVQDITIDVDAGSTSVLKINAPNEDVNFNLAGSTIKSEGTNAWGGDRAVNVNAGNVVIENGTIDAFGNCEGTYGSGAYGAIKITGGDVTVQNMILKNYRKMGMDIKVTGGTVDVKDTTITAQHGGGIEAGGISTSTVVSTVDVSNVTITQSGDDHGSCAGACLAACYGGTLNVASGSYTSENVCVYMYSSGGNINLTGGSYKSTGSKALIINSVSDSGTTKVNNVDTDIIDYNGLINISGGTFETTGSGKMFSVGISDKAHDAGLEVKITITGGTFNGKTFSSITQAEWEAMCAEGATVTMNSGSVVITPTTPFKQ